MYPTPTFWDKCFLVVDVGGGGGGGCVSIWYGSTQVSDIEIHLLYQSILPDIGQKWHPENFIWINTMLG